MRQQGLLLLAFALTAAGAFGQPIACDRFALQAALAGSQLTISLDTDLPPETTIMVSVSRSYWAGKPLEEYPINYLEESATVGEWRKPRVVTVDHGAWRQKLDERTRTLAKAGIPDKVVRVDTDVTVSFTVPINQPDPRFGTGNRNLVGKMVATTGLRVVRAERKVKHPFRAGTQPVPKEFAGPDGLHRGLKYQVSRQTPLMPERHPADPIKALAMVQRLPAGTILTVLAVDRSDTSKPWYRVSAATAGGAVLGAGWLNSDALIGQEVRVVR